MRDRCVDCGAPLLGSWTIHATDCTFFEMLLELFPEWVRIKEKADE